MPAILMVRHFHVQHFQSTLDNSKQKEKIQQKINKLAQGKKNTQKTLN